MKRLAQVLSAATLLVIFALRTLAAPEEEDKGKGWRDTVQNPINALFMFNGSFNGNGELTIVIGGVTNSILNEGEWGCAEAGWETTPWEEVSLVLDHTYDCSITADDAAGMYVDIKRVPLHTLLDRGGALD